MKKLIFVFFSFFFTTLISNSAFGIDFSISSESQYFFPVENGKTFLNDTVKKSNRNARKNKYFKRYAIQIKDVSGLPLSDVSAVYAGHANTFVIRGNGTVWSWGSNFYGQLGDGTKKDRLRPVQVMDSSGIPLKNVTAVSSRRSSVLALKKNGTVWSWGSNFFGQLGDGTEKDRLHPVQVVDSKGSPLSNVAAVSAGSYHSIALKNNGTVWAWGNNDFGKVGDGTKKDRSYPVQVLDLSDNPLNDVSVVSGGDYESLALRSAGAVWSWGYYYSSYEIKRKKRFKPRQLLDSSGSPLTGFSDVSYGDTHVVALKDDGSVWTWESNFYSQLGYGTKKGRSYPVQVSDSSGSPLSDVVAISAGSGYSIALKNDGTVWSWGNNYSGQLGDGTGKKKRLHPIQVVDLSGAPLKNITAISAGLLHSVALKDDGTVWSWGYSSSGELGFSENKPDLAIKLIKAKRKVVKKGTKVKILVVLKNNGERKKYNPYFNLYLYLSDNSKKTYLNDIFIIRDTGIKSIKKNKRKKISLSWKVPKNIKRGNYFIKVFSPVFGHSMDSNLDNNIGVSKKKIRIK